MKERTLRLLTWPVYFALAINASAQDSLTAKPDTVTFNSGQIRLKGLLWKPGGEGPFPAMLFNHGSELNSLSYLPWIAFPFVQEGYVFFAPFRRGQSLSQGQGRYIADASDSVRKQSGREAALNTVMRLHETEQLSDQLAALKTLNGLPYVDTGRVAVAGVSFGGIQSMLIAAEQTNVKAALNFAGAAMMWDSSVAVQGWMKGIARKARIPVYFIQAENDFSIQPSVQMAAVMQEAGKPHQSKIYPPSGATKMNGHMFVWRGVAIWRKDAFEFLKQHLK